MIASDVVTRVRRIFGDDAAVQVQDADVIRWINDGQVEIVKHNDGALQKTGLIDLVAGQSSYTLPTDLLILRSLRYKYASMLSFSSIKYKNMQEFDDSIDGWDGIAYPVSSPELFTMYEGKAILFPTPDQSVTGGLKVLYNQKPTDVVLVSDALALPLIYHNTLLKYCMWQASLLDEDHDPAAMYRNDFQSDMDLLLTRETTEAVATYPTITVLEYDQ
ncbi:MAG: hypothetical protein HMLIMOIP_002102 [Candidatus Nitrosomirales archaeon]|jgi:hypothetical protein